MRCRPGKCNAGSSIHHSQQRACEAQCHWCLPALCGAGARPSNYQRHPSRRAWPPCGFKSTCRQSLPPWFFLADCSRRRQGLGPKMQRVPEILFQATSAGFCTQDYSHCLALCCLGPGHGRTIQDGTRWFDSFTCCSGQVRQVDRSKANQEFEWADCYDFHR